MSAIQICTNRLLALSLFQAWPEGLSIWKYRDSRKERKNQHYLGRVTLRLTKKDGQIVLEEILFAVKSTKKIDFLEYFQNVPFQLQENYRKKIKKNIDRQTNKK
jgi:hypothetical protein